MICRVACIRSARSGDIDERGVGSEFPRQVQSFAPIFRLPHDLDVSSGFNQ
jgi:hypothetical protein